MRFLNNYSACHPFKYNPENADSIFTEVLQDIDILPFGEPKNELTYIELQYMSNFYWYLKSFAQKQYISNPHILAMCQQPEVTLDEYPENDITDPFKEKILAGLKRSLWSAGIAQVEKAEEIAHSYARTRMPFKPDLLFGYNGVKVALFINNSYNGKS